MSEVMIDIETLDTKSSACIIAIALLEFKRTDTIAPLQNMRSLFLRVKSESCTEKGMTTSPETVEWWNKQDRKVREDVFEGKKYTIDEALTILSEYISLDTIVWCQGLSFDVPILQNAYNMCNMTVPWKYYNTRDTRTIYDICKHRYEYPRELHNPIYDCYSQVNAVKNCIKKLNK